MTYGIGTLKSPNPNPICLMSAPNAGLVYRHTSPSKQRRDKLRQLLHEEKRKLFHDAYKDQGIGKYPSPGEIDALTDSKILGVKRGDVLKDPKLNYWHPNLRPRA